jgi:nuclear pore complex protein Nup205
MAEAHKDSLEALQGLHQDLLALSESRLPVLERLRDQLEHTTQEFRSLLDKPEKSTASRNTLSSGK